MVWKIILAIALGYFVGCINPTYIMGRMHGIDVRKSGSGNAGASNGLILMGKWVGIVSALFDIFKAATVMWLAPVIFGDILCIAEVTGVACVMGHIFPIFMKFKGGKGLACLGGVLLAIDWRLLLILLAIEIAVVLIVDYICIVPITASLALPILYGVFGNLGLGWLRRAEGGFVGVWIFAALAVVIVLKHLQNIYRVATHTEMPFSFLWSKDKEGDKARIERNRELLREKRLAKQQKGGQA